MATQEFAKGRGTMRRGWTKLTSRECTLRRCKVVDWLPVDSLQALTDGFVRGERWIETLRKNDAVRRPGLTTCDSSRTQEQTKVAEGKQRAEVDENIKKKRLISSDRNANACRDVWKRRKRDPTHLWVVRLSGTRPLNSRASQETKNCACISAIGRRKTKRPTEGSLPVGFT